MSDQEQGSDQDYSRIRHFEYAILLAVWIAAACIGGLIVDFVRH